MKVRCCGSSDVDLGASPVQGSVYEGAGRKLRGTEAMRMRNAVGSLLPCVMMHLHSVLADSHCAPHQLSRLLFPGPRSVPLLSG